MQEYVAFAEKSGVLCEMALKGLPSAAIAWLAPFQGPVCAGNGMNAFGSPSQRMSVPPSTAARSERFLKSPPTSAPTSSRPQDWNT